jgi:hypothetical protein
VNWTELDWPALDKLRDRFLSGAAVDGPYWQSESELASYDLTYAERIGWKWDAVLQELKLRGWTLPAPANARKISILDWGCGTGVASRRVISSFGPERFETLYVWDHSPMAASFAGDAASQAFPDLSVVQVTPRFLQSDEPIDLLVISHVLNELPAASLAELRALITRAEVVLWVEAGTHAVSRQLGTIRDELRAEFRIVAPCTHQTPCPMLTPENERHWCHHFAPPPSEIFANPDWVKFGQRAGIDLRSLPYCFLALDRGTAAAPTATAPEGLSRIIGRPEHFKPYARVLNCDASGLAELTISKRTLPALYKQLDRTKAPLIYRWSREGSDVIGGEPLAER